MKKHYLSLFLAFVLCLSLIACGESTVDPSPGTDHPTTTQSSTDAVTTVPATDAVTTSPVTDAVTTEPDTAPPSTTPPESQAPETTPPEIDPAVLPTVSQNGNVIDYLYPQELTEALCEQLETNASYFSVFFDGTAPYMMQTEEFLCAGAVNSISFPLAKTGIPHQDGNYQITLFVFGKDLTTGLKQSPKGTFVAKIDGDLYDLQANKTINKWIKIDVSNLDITLTENETLAFFAPGDTLFPYYSTNTVIKDLIDRHTDAGTGYISCVGTEQLNLHAGTLIFNVGMERSYTPDSDTYQAIVAEKVAYGEMLSLLRDQYKGKKVSILGDSISTWGGICNDSVANATIGQNTAYYPANGSVLSNVDHTYWKQIIDALDMELCVNNSWHGSRVYGKESSYSDSAVKRATQLHKDNGTPTDPSDDTLPDVIFFYMGINDINNKLPFGDLLTRLSEYNTLDEKLNYIDQWLTDLRLRTGDFHNMNAGNQYTTFQDAYALALYQIYEAYPNAEVYCMNLIPNIKYMNNHQQSTATIESYNEFIQLVASYFEFTVVDQYQNSYMKYDTNIQFYTVDMDLLLHPNAGGHTKTADLFLNTMAAKNKLK